MQIAVSDELVAIYAPLVSSSLGFAVATHFHFLPDSHALSIRWPFTPPRIPSSHLLKPILFDAILSLIMLLAMPLVRAAFTRLALIDPSLCQGWIALESWSILGEGFVSRLGAQGLLVYFVKAWGVVVSMVTRFRLITMGV